MATNDVSPEARFICGHGPKALLFRRMQGTEELGRMWEYRVELLRSQKLVPLEVDSVLGSKVSVALLLDGGEERFFNGWVTAVESGGAVGRFDIYRVEMRPWLWYLTLTQDCKIFQNKTTQEILQAVFDKYSNASVEFNIQGQTRTRPYCVQYRETDFNFVSRLLEEEGLFYYFKHEETRHTMVICNQLSSLTACASSPLVWGPDADTGPYDENNILQWRRVQQERSTKFTHTDFDYLAPSTSLQKTAQWTPSVSGATGLEIYDHRVDFAFPADGTNATEGQDRADKEVKRFEGGHIVARAASPCRAVGAGMTFEFTGHEDAAEYAVTACAFEFDPGDLEATSDVRGAPFTARLTLVKKSGVWLPEAVTPKPVMRGPQTAWVVGPSGEEIYTDEYGRVKVQFHWDRVGTKDENSSCFVRVATPWASKQFGMITLPRIGDEVVVEFLEGNPDRPLITGSVYNAENMPPYALPAQKTVSGIRSRSSKEGATTNFNELRFDDNKGSEYVWMQAEKDFHRLVKNDHTDEIRHDSRTDIANNEATHIGNDKQLIVGNNMSVQIGADATLSIAGNTAVAMSGTLTHDIGDSATVKIAQATELAIGGACDIDVAQQLNITAGSALHLVAGSTLIIDAGASICIKAGGSSIVLGADGVSITGTLVKINSGGSASPGTKAKKASPPSPPELTKPDVKVDPLA
jgi:type VI secretion system secreted protein VgrG